MGCSDCSNGYVGDREGDVDSIVWWVVGSGDGTAKVILVGAMIRRVAVYRSNGISSNRYWVSLIVCCGVCGVATAATTVSISDVIICRV